MQRKYFNTQTTIGLSLLLTLLVLWGCSPTRRLKPNEKLVNKVYIKTDNKNISESEVRSYLRQQPNRKLLGFWRFYLQIYNLVDPKKAEEAHERKVKRKAERIDKRNARRNARCERRKTRTGKDCKPREREDIIEAKSFREWIQGIGEPPTVYDANQTPISCDQIRQYLFNNGYFHATVKDSTIDTGHKKVNTYFIIKSGLRYNVSQVTYTTTDTTIQRIVNDASADKTPIALLPFNSESIGLERDRITKLLKNKGYYFFSNEFIKVKTDSGFKNKTCTIDFIIANPRVPVTGYADSTIESTHKIYRIRNVVVNTQYIAGQDDYSTYSKKEYQGVEFLYHDSLNLFRPKALHHHIVIKEGAIYSDNELEYTLTRLGDLKVFKFINIQFLPTDTTTDNATLDCFILLNPAMRRSFGIEAQGTNTSGNLGIGANFSFINKNLFKGAEYFEFKVKGALEAQRVVNESTVSNDAGIRNSPFNTQELGVSMTLNIPRGVFPINYFVRKQFKNPRTQITTSYNFQERPQYKRNLYTLAFGWTWRQSKSHRMYVTYNPIEINYIKAVITDAEFGNLINSSKVLSSSFEDALIENGRVAITWTNQIVGKRKNYIFWRFGAESAGLVANAFAPKRLNNFGSYDKEILKVKSAQYIRSDFEIYPNIYLNKRNSFAFRGYIGGGLAYRRQDDAIPFARAFFSGGSNGMRAWVQRSLGPGILNKSDTINQVDQVGDIKIEFNAEYRLKLFSFIETALFVDVGNIWLARKDPNRPGGTFYINQFYKEFGIGYGVGVRLDLSFFLLRLDFAQPLRDPGQQYGKLWLEPKLKRTAFNLGIGYPF